MNNKKKFILLSLIAIALIAGYLGYGLTPRNMRFFLNLRMRKILAIIIVSYSIGYSTISFQTLTNNRILTPGVMGIDSLYLFIQTVVVFFFGGRQLIMISSELNFITTILIMILASIFMYHMLFKGTIKNLYFLVLVGMVFGQFFSGLSTFMQVLLDPNEFLILQGRMFATFSNINVNLLNISLAITVIAALFTYKDIKHLNVLSLGKDYAISLGVPYNALVRRQLIIIFILTSTSTVLVGPVTFLGILIVSLAKEIFATYKHHTLTIATTLISIIFLVGAIILTERVFSFNIVIGTIINFIGGIYFIFLMTKEVKHD